jgi:hypothetical protein
LCRFQYSGTAGKFKRSFFRVRGENFSLQKRNTRVCYCYIAIGITGGLVCVFFSKSGAACARKPVPSCTRSGSGPARPGSRAGYAAAVCGTDGAALDGGKGLFIESNNPQAFDFVPFAALEAGRYTEHKIETIKEVIGSDCSCCEHEATHFWVPRHLVQKRGNRLRLSTEVEEYGQIRGYCAAHMPEFFREYLKRQHSLLKRFCLPQRSESGVFY